MARFQIVVLLSVMALITNSYCQGLNTILEQSLTVPATEVTATMLELNFQPGDQGLPPHKHPGPVVGYVIEGELLFQVQGGPIQVYSAGQAFYEANGAVHVWGANASNSTAAKVVVACMGTPGEPIVTIVDNVNREDYETALKLAKKKE